VKKKIFGGSIMVFILSLAIFLGFKIGYNRVAWFDYTREKGYSVFSGKMGIVTSKEAAEKIGEAVLIEKNIRGDKPLNVTYEEQGAYGLWIVSVTSNSGESDVVTSVLIHRFGDIKVVTHKK
jgi:hypothetical protein